MSSKKVHQWLCIIQQTQRRIHIFLPTLRYVELNIYKQMDLQPNELNKKKQAYKIHSERVRDYFKLWSTIYFFIICPTKVQPKTSNYSWNNPTKQLNFTLEYSRKINFTLLGRVIFLAQQLNSQCRVFFVSTTFSCSHALPVHSPKRRP